MLASKFALLIVVSRFVSEGVRFSCLKPLADHHIKQKIHPK